MTEQKTGPVVLLMTVVSIITMILGIAGALTFWAKQWVPRAVQDIVIEQGSEAGVILFVFWPLIAGALIHMGYPTPRRLMYVNVATLALSGTLMILGTFVVWLVDFPEIITFAAPFLGIGYGVMIWATLRRYGDVASPWITESLDEDGRECNHKNGLWFGIGLVMASVVILLMYLAG